MPVPTDAGMAPCWVSALRAARSDQSLPLPPPIFVTTMMGTEPSADQSTAGLHQNSCGCAETADSAGRKQGTPSGVTCALSGRKLEGVVAAWRTDTSAEPLLVRMGRRSTISGPAGPSPEGCSDRGDGAPVVGNHGQAGIPANGTLSLGRRPQPAVRPLAGGGIGSGLSSQSKLIEGSSFVGLTRPLRSFSPEGSAGQTSSQDVGNSSSSIGPAGRRLDRVVQAGFAATRWS